VVIEGGLYGVERERGGWMDGWMGGWERRAGLKAFRGFFESNFWASILSL